MGNRLIFDFFFFVFTFESITVRRKLFEYDLTKFMDPFLVRQKIAGPRVATWWSSDWPLPPGHQHIFYAWPMSLTWPNSWYRPLLARRESVWVFGRMSTSRPTNWLPHSGVCQPAAGHIVQLFNAKPTATAAAAVTCQKTTGRRFSLKDKRPSNNKNVLLLPPSPFEERQEKSWRYYPDLYFGKSRSAVAVRSCRVTNWLLSVRNVPSWTSRGKVCVRVSV